MDFECLAVSVSIDHQTAQKVMSTILLVTVVVIVGSAGAHIGQPGNCRGQHFGKGGEMKDKRENHRVTNGSRLLIL